MHTVSITSSSSTNNVNNLEIKYGEEIMILLINHFFNKM